MGGKSSPTRNAAVKTELRSPRGPQISSIFCMLGLCGVVTVLWSHRILFSVVPQSASTDDTGYRPQVSRLLFILATAVQQSQEHGSSYPRIICFVFCFFFPPFAGMFNALSRVNPSFWSKNITGEKEGGLQREERESELRNPAAPNPWVTTGEAQMSAYIKATGIVFKTTGAVLLSFQCAEAH